MLCSCKVYEYENTALYSISLFHTNCHHTHWRFIILSLRSGKQLGREKSPKRLCTAKSNVESLVDIVCCFPTAWHVFAFYLFHANYKLKQLQAREWQINTEAKYVYFPLLLHRPYFLIYIFLFIRLISFRLGCPFLGGLFMKRETT